MLTATSLVPRLLLAMLLFTALGFAAVQLFGYHVEIIVYSLSGTAYVVYRMVLVHKMRHSTVDHGTRHYHRNEQGALVRCFHTCKSLLWQPAFWIGTAVSFPFEHFLYEKVWPFYCLTNLMGL